MSDLYDTYKPEGFHSVTPYLFAHEPENLIEFLKNAFNAVEIQRTLNGKGEIGNCIIKLGDSCMMISQARSPFTEMNTSFYLFTEDVDKMYHNALKHKAQDIFAPADMDYGDRQAGVKDPEGNYWWISKRLKKKNYQDN